MTTGRTVLRFWRVYCDGYDLSGQARTIGPLETTFDEGMDDAMSNPIKGVLPGQAVVKVGTLNGIFNNTATSGIHAAMSGYAGTDRVVSVALGIQAAPAEGDPVFAGQFEQLGYAGKGDEPIATVSVPFGNSSALSGNLYYAQPWGILLHALSAATAVNTANGYGGDGQTTKGGWMAYHVSTAAGSGAMTATIKVQDCATAGGTYSDLLSSGSLSLGSSGTFSGPIGGIVALTPTATVESYTRWQIVLTLATSVTFAVSFHRGYLP